MKLQKVKAVERQRLLGGELWIATLDCGHIRYLKHKPKVGEEMDCKGVRRSGGVEERCGGYNLHIAGKIRIIEHE